MTSPGSDRFDRVADLGVAAIAIAVVAVLTAQAGAARFFADECFHAHVARWIADHGALPRVLPEFYSGYAYAYPPLFHLIGAAVAKSGTSSLITAGIFKTVAFILLSPLLGLTFGTILMIAVAWIFRRTTPWRVDKWFRRMQLATA